MENRPRSQLLNNLTEKYSTQQHQIVFEEEKSYGYKTRTIKNANADATLAFAIDFTTAGEILTKSSVENQGKKYIPIHLSDMTSQMSIDIIVNDLNSCSARTLNIAGNGLFTMKGKYTQPEIDKLTYDLLRGVLSSPLLKNKIELIRSGGQTGFDEAGIKAAVKLDVPALILAPKGWVFRDIDGTDIRDEKAFKNRFKTI